MEWSISVMVEVGTEDSGHQNRVDMMLSTVKQARIKDGKLSKYDSQRINVNTPNILMVFSNDAPNTSRLAKDCWKLFFIENDQLKECDI